LARGIKQDRSEVGSPGVQLAANAETAPPFDVVARPNAPAMREGSTVDHQLYVSDPDPGLTARVCHFCAHLASRQSNPVG
jgi:hypothetical protein